MCVFNQKTEFLLPPGSQLELNKELARKRDGENECKEQRNARKEEGAVEGHRATERKQTRWMDGICHAEWNEIGR